jgi:hypothetical protein
VLLLLLVALALPAAYFFYSRWEHHAAMERAIAETDALDPGWRLADIEAARKTYRDEDNIALQVIKVRGMIGKRRAPGHEKDYEAVFQDLPAPAQLNVQQLMLIRQALEQYPDAVIEARKIKDLPGGRFPLKISPDFISTLLPDHQEARVVADLLEHDAMLRAHGGDPDAALESCAATLHVGRAFGDEGFLISLLLRISCYQRGIEAAERTLAQGHAKEASLAALQKRVAAERAELQQRWVDGVRGERAGQFQFMNALREGRIRLGDYMVNTLRIKVPYHELIATNVLPELYTREYPNQLRHMNESVAAARLPLEQQMDRFAALEVQVDRTSSRKAQLAKILPFLPPDLTKVCNAHLRTHANLAAAETAIACERYRLTHQRWPESLADVVKAGLLESIPDDPLDGQPLRFARLKDGIAVYSPGFDRDDNGGNIDRANPLNPGVDLGFRLWDPAARRQPPRPIVALPR